MPERGNVEDIWAHGRAYERYIGRWSRPVADEFVAGLDIGPGTKSLDVGCGTGALTTAILARATPASVTAVDRSDGFVSAAAEQIGDDRVRFAVADAASLPAGPFDVVVSGLVLNFLPEPREAVAAMARAAPGGTVAAYVWDQAEGMRLIRHFWDAAAALDPAAAALDEARRFSLCQPAELERLWRAAGLTDVRTTAITVPTVFADFDDYWLPFLGGQGPAPTYVASLDEAAQAALHDRLRRSLPINADGTIALTARAWAVRGAT